MKSPKNKAGFVATGPDNFMARLEGGLHFGMLDGRAALGARVAPEDRQSFMDSMRLNVVFYRSMAERIELFLAQYEKESS